jgi:hypothetical protein
MSNDETAKFLGDAPDDAEEIKSRILQRISKEVEARRNLDHGGEFGIATGAPIDGISPVADTYYKGGSYVKTHITK